MPDTTPLALAETIGTALTVAAETAGSGNAEDRAEIRAIADAMVRLMAGAPLHSDGQLTVKSLAAEAQLKRHKLTHKHTGLKDLFYGLVRSQGPRPQMVQRLDKDNARLREQIDSLRREHRELKERHATFARVIHVLEVENAQLRQVQASTVVRAFPQRQG
ncbi:hypothetical protein [Streptomyces virginiae]|uniref:hypothetical protein n=1 Tax=Streptomyces virginiae TaxID=1961 RepID=UPI0032503203